MKNGHKVEELILDDLKYIKEKLDEIRTKTIPELQTKFAVDHALAKDRMSREAKIITAVGGAITLAVSTAIAWFK